ncbi:MAG: type III ribulose-bisphosphate carboxylase [Nanoarchaeota archaeon]|nr:type III ribulose-bisphosphate carboxylase [Nanoarchaeota archaeon]MBU4353057.1 type III ribulose-bisphosphate carboxylase [Nanoarchaeota archaeon]MBU4457065.1 type III ribulose-bisphosphate carboxylase [Nanoarchaeota archaeon]MCG2719516.1 type III ribulose-bisphosphate carboxylase [Nanoarchaeota archaeon]
MANYEEFVDLKYKPKATDVVALFRVKVPKWSTPKRAYGAVAAESSVGTWSEMKSTHFKHVQKVAAKVFDVKGDWIKIAYPEEHFEAGNMSQILASIAGNVFGMKAVDSLRLEDIQFTKKIVKSFPGPKFGREGIRKIFGVKKRPLMLSVAKPKVGLTTKEHVEIGRQIWEGGLDLLKDDENLANQSFNPFNKRVVDSLKVRDKIEKKTGEKKSYLINITGPTVKEMEKRAKFVKAQGGEYIMIDIITTGWSAVHSMREICDDLGLAIHAHRAMHGAMTRDKYQGFSMHCVAKCARLLGVDQLHIGTANIGKLVGSEQEVLELEKMITQDKYKSNNLTLNQEWYGTKPVFPVSSGGLHPLIIDKVMDKMGTNIMLQIGGGIHGHPMGSFAGAKAMREAVEAYLDGIDLAVAAKKSKELKTALDIWGRKGTR